MHRFIGALTTKGAVSLSQRRLATKVWVIQCPKGALQRSRWPFGQQPRRRVILVVVPVSSRKTSRCGSSRIRGWRVVVHSSRAAFVSGRTVLLCCLPGLVEKDQPMRLKPHSRLACGGPFLARRFDVGTILLARQ